MLFCLLLVCEVFSLPMARSLSRPVELYSHSGKLMNIFRSGRVVASGRKRHLTTVIQVIPVGINQFHFQGALSGQFVKITKTGKVVGSVFASEASVFSEEILSENNFSSFVLAERPGCRLTTRGSKYRVACRTNFKTKSISFLPRRTHIPRTAGMFH